MPFDSLNSNRITATTEVIKQKPSKCKIAGSRYSDRAVTARGKKVCKINNVEKKTYQSSNQGPPYLTPASLTTESLLPWLMTSLNFCFISEISTELKSAYNQTFCNFIDLPIEVLDCSRTFYVCSITSPHKNVHSIRVLQ